MLARFKVELLVDNFAMQWLQLRNLRHFAPDVKLFPGFDESLRTAMFKETELLFTEIIKEDRPILDLIDAQYTFLNHAPRIIMESRIPTALGWVRKPKSLAGNRFAARSL